VHYKKFLPFLLAFALPLLIIYAWWGGFAPVDIRSETRGPYTYAYLEHTGDFAKLTEHQAHVLHDLKKAGIPAGDAITVLYSNPDIVPRGQRQARTGYLIPADARPPAPLKVDVIPARPVLTVRVRAAILLAPSRAYQALDSHQQALGRGIAMPTVELYEAADSVWRMGVLTVEMPVSKEAS
jgi:hypothetical protein